MPNHNADKRLVLLYCNMNRSTHAHDEMDEQMRKTKADIICCSEPNWHTVSKEEWTSDHRKDTAITYRQLGPRIYRRGCGTGFCWVELQQIIVHACYVSPNVTMTHFKTFLRNLESSIINQHKGVVIMGDFNAKSRSWGSQKSDRRGKTLLEWTATQNLAILNDGKEPTFERGGTTSFIDLTFISAALTPDVTDWRVLHE